MSLKTSASEEKRKKKTEKRTGERKEESEGALTHEKKRGEKGK